MENVYSIERIEKDLEMEKASIDENSEMPFSDNIINHKLLEEVLNEKIGNSESEECSDPSPNSKEVCADEIAESKQRNETTLIDNQNEMEDINDTVSKKTEESSIRKNYEINQIPFKNDIKVAKYNEEEKKEDKRDLNLDKSTAENDEEEKKEDKRDSNLDKSTAENQVEADIPISNFRS